MVSGRGGLASGGDASALALEGAEGGAVCAARASRWRVTLLRPTRMWDPISGGGGAVSGTLLLASLLVSFCDSRFRFFPLDGGMCVLRWSPNGCNRLGSGQKVSCI